MSASHFPWEKLTFQNLLCRWLFEFEKNFLPGEWRIRTLLDELCNLRRINFGRSWNFDSRFSPSFKGISRFELIFRARFKIQKPAKRATCGLCFPVICKARVELKLGRNCPTCVLGRFGAAESQNVRKSTKFETWFSRSNRTARACPFRSGNF